MAFDRIRIPGLDDASEDTLNTLLENLYNREPRNLLRESFYDGKRKARQVSAVLPPMYKNLGMVLGWSAKAVDALARRCNLVGFSWNEGDLDALGYRTVWDDNYLQAEINSAIISSLMHGPAFLINTQGLDTEPTSLIHVRDARHATGTWNSRTRSLDNLVSVQRWDDDHRPVELALYLNDLTIVCEKDSSGWQVDHQDHGWGVPAEAMVYKYRVGRPFGSSRISRPVMSLHEAALRELPRLEAHMDVYAMPDYWMLGADESIFKNADGSVKASWQIALGRVKGIPDDDEAANPRADVKQFSASSPEPHLAALNGYAKMFARETALPDSALAITDVSNPTSADSYDASQYELIAEAEGAADDWSRPLSRSLLRALAIAQGETTIPREWSSIIPEWRNPRFVSRAAEADAGMKVLSVAPELQGTRLGYELLGLTRKQVDAAVIEGRRTRGLSSLEAIAAAAAQVRDAANTAPPTG